MAGLDSEVEEEEREGNGGLREADLGERAGKSEAVEEAEGKCDDPGIALGDAGASHPAVQDLCCDEDDTESDDGLDGGSGDLDESEGEGQ